MASECQFCMIAAYKYQHSYVKPVCFYIASTNLGSTAIHRPDEIDVSSINNFLILQLIYVNIVK